MAQILLSAGFAGVKGKLRGDIFQINKGVQIIRSRSQQSRSNTVQMQQPKKLIARVSQQWRTLSDANRATYQAQTINYPTVDKFGNPRTPSAFELFMRLAMITYGVYQFFNSNCLPPQSITDIGTGSATYGGLGGLDVNWQNPVTANENIFIAASPVVSKGRTNSSVPYKILAVAGNGGATTEDITTPYANNFGGIILGGRIFIRIYVIHALSGQEGVRQEFSVAT